MSRGYLLDTGVLNAYLRGKAGAVALVEPWVASGQASTSMLVYGEIVEFLQSLPDFPSRDAELREVLREVRPHHLDYSILRRYAVLRRGMRRSTGLIGDIDTLIAATALERDRTVVTLDSDFTRVPDLDVLLLDRRDVT
jgi:predicted nucleic acid-binding protein